MTHKNRAIQAGPQRIFSHLIFFVACQQQVHGQFIGISHLSASGILLDTTYYLNSKPSEPGLFPATRSKPTSF
jgi:hypothetical protein